MRRTVLLKTYLEKPSLFSKLHLFMHISTDTHTTRDAIPSPWPPLGTPSLSTNPLGRGAPPPSASLLRQPPALASSRGSSLKSDAVTRASRVPRCVFATRSPATSRESHQITDNHPRFVDPMIMPIARIIQSAFTTDWEKLVQGYRSRDLFFWAEVGAHVRHGEILPMAKLLCFTPIFSCYYPSYIVFVIVEIHASEGISVLEYVERLSTSLVDCQSSLANQKAKTIFSIYI